MRFDAYQTVNMERLYWFEGDAAATTGMITVTNGGERAVYEGSFSFKSNGDLAGGTVTQFTYFSSGNTVGYQVSGLNLAAKNVFNFINKGDTTGLMRFANDKGDGSKIFGANTAASTLWGGKKNDDLFSSHDGDILKGEGGSDTYWLTLTSNAKAPTVIEGIGKKGGNDQVKLTVEYAGTGTYDLPVGIEELEIYSTTANMILRGNDMANKITGGSGNDVIHGGAGQNTLAGSAGDDQFVFDVMPKGKKGYSKITDWETGDDTIVLDSKVFTKLTPGILPSSQFSGTKSLDADDFLVFSNGILHYDADGSGKGKAVPIVAVRGPDLSVDATDIFII